MVPFHEPQSHWEANHGRGNAYDLGAGGRETIFRSEPEWVLRRRGPRRDTGHPNRSTKACASAANGAHARSSRQRAGSVSRLPIINSQWSSPPIYAPARVLDAELFAGGMETSPSAPMG